MLCVCVNQGSFPVASKQSIDRLSAAADTLRRGQARFGPNLSPVGYNPLEAIDLGGTRVGDESLQYLVGMPLVYIDVHATRVSDVGFQMLEREFPGAGISR